jgi:hypothetical protein
MICIDSSSHKEVFHKIIIFALAFSSLFPVSRPLYHPTILRRTFWSRSHKLPSTWSRGMILL